MAHTLTFESPIKATVDGVSVTSPYTLTKSCTVKLTVTDRVMSIGGGIYMPPDNQSIRYTDRDINAFIQTMTRNPKGVATVTIDYTETVVKKISVDLTTLAGWANLASGSHTLTVRAKADGYTTSDASTGVTFTKAAAGYTVTFSSNFSFSNVSGYSPSATIVADTGAQAQLSQASTKGLVWHGVTSLTTTGVDDQINDIDYTESGISKTWDGSGTLTLTGDIIINSAVFQCLTGDTLITLADGSTKRIDEIALSDKVLSYNPETMELEADEITYCDSTENKTHTEYDIWTFSDGTLVKTVHRHRLYNVERQAMVYIDDWRIGEHAINIHGEHIELVGHENVKEEVRHYTLFTKNQNYFVNGLLSGNRHTKEMHL